MKKVLMFLGLFLITTSISIAQNSRQSEMLEDFFQDRGAKVLAQWAHPEYSWYPNQTRVYVY